MKNKKQLSEICALWQADKKQYVKKSTLSAYVLLAENHLLPQFGTHHHITETEVQAFVLQKIAAGLSQKTIKDMLIVLKMILKFGAKQHAMDYSPFDIQFPTQCKSQKLEVLSRAEHKKIVKHIQEHFTFRNLGVYICLNTGMRIGEICALKWDDIDIEKGLIHVNKTIQRIYTIDKAVRKTELLLDTPKTKNAIREIPLSSDLLKLLKPIKKIVNPCFFVLTNEAKPTEPRTYRSYYKKLLQDLQIPELKFHGLRHSFATRCIESKCDYKTVSVLLGHANISTTLNLYVHPNFEQKKKAINQMYRSLQ